VLRVSCGGECGDFGSCGRELVGVLVCGVQGMAEDVSSVPGAGQVSGGAGDDLVGVVTSSPNPSPQGHG
jgi:hypothetical protein